MMSGFSDQLMLRYLDPANVDLLLTPQADVNRQRSRSLLAEVYEPGLLAVESVDSVTVTAKSFQVRLVEPASVRGSWERLTPTSERTLATFDMPTIARTRWIDMALETVVSVRVSVTSGALDALASEDVSELSQQAFVSKFQFLDLPGLMKAANVASYQELQADFPRLYRLHYASPDAFDPNDPRARRPFRLRVSVLFFPVLDLQDAMRQLVDCRAILNSVRPQPEQYEGGNLLGSSAWMGVFPTTALDPKSTQITQDQVSALFAAEGFVAAFEAV